MKILLVEDDIFLQKFYASKLQERGIEVAVASDGKEALDKVKVGQFNVLLLDLIMPKMDGFDVLQQLAADDNLKKIPVIVFSNLGQEQDVEKAKQLGARDYINKSSIDFEELLKKIQLQAGISVLV